MESGVCCINSCSCNLAFPEIWMCKEYLFTYEDSGNSNSSFALNFRRSNNQSMKKSIYRFSRKNKSCYKLRACEISTFKNETLNMIFTKKNISLLYKLATFYKRIVTDVQGDGRHILTGTVGL